MSTFKRLMRRRRLELRRVRASALRCPGCARTNVIVVDDRGNARCTNCEHVPAPDLLR